MSTMPADHDTRISLGVDTDGTVRLAWAPGVLIDGELARSAMRAVDQLNGPRRRPLAVALTGTATLTREGRQQFARPCSASRVALVGRSAVDRVIANFALLVSTPPAPTRYFTSESEALEWLRDDCTLS